MRHSRRHGLLPLLQGLTLLALAACPGSRDTLLAELQSSRPEERATAVRKLARQARAEDLVLFTQAARDPAAIVRGEAIAALGRSQDSRVVDLLGELLGDPDDTVQARAAMALAEIKSDKAKAYLTAQYSRRGRGTRHAIVQALKSANVPGAMANVVAAEAQAIWDRNLEALNHGSLPERVAAAEELGKSGKPEAVNRLVPLLKDSQVVLAAAAARGLGYAGDRRAAPAVVEVLGENYPELREASCTTLLRLGETSALPKLVELAVERSAASPPALAAIAGLPASPETDQALCKAALEASPPEAEIAGREMRRRGGCPLEPVVERLRQGSNTTMALLAVASFGPAAKEALPKVLPLLSSSDSTVRRLAVDAAAELGDPAAVPALQKLFDEEQKRIQYQRADWIPGELNESFEPILVGGPRQSAVKARQEDLFEKVGKVDALRAAQQNKMLLEPRPPRELLDDVSEEQLRLLASLVRALGVLKAEGAKELLLSYAEDPSASLRTAAFLGLIVLGGDDLGPVRPALVDAERSVQGKVAVALAEAGPKGQALLVDLLPRLAGDKTRLLEPLARAGAPVTAIPALETIVREGGGEAAIAARLLGSLKSRGSIPVLQRYLDEPTATGRREVLLALGQIGDPRAVETVARDLYHDSPEVRAAAAEALASLDSRQQLESSGALDALDALKGDYYRKVRDSAAAALSRIQPASAQDASR